MTRSIPPAEHDYDRLRSRQWLAGQARGDGFSRRDLLRLAGAMGAAAAATTAPAEAAAATPPAGPAAEDGRPRAGAVTDAGTPAAGQRTGAVAAAPPIVKPLPPELFEVYGSNAEMRWSAMAGQGYLVPTDRFFVRNHTSTPLLDADSWRLRLFGTGLRGSPTADDPIELSHRDLRRMPAETRTAAVECAGNGRSFFTSQQGQTVSGTAWKLGAVGVARWRGVRLSTVLRHAGLTGDAVDVLPTGLDADYVTGGVNLGPVRRPLPLAKARHDVLLAYEMNGRPLLPDHGFPVRLVVPGWIGISSIKWLGSIEVADGPLFSPWNTQFYRLFGPGYPADGQLIGPQVVKSAFELPWAARLPAGAPIELTGRSWSGAGRIRTVEVSIDDGRTWRRAKLSPGPAGASWRRWRFRWQSPAAGAYTLRARATDVTGATQPDEARFNTLGYLFDGVVRHPVTVG
ncbi:sulfite oxidase [Plantactinospora siamensis]|uniref:Sulfite oxidase n=1 Tax=Plantactinospora siamensis TaxID=555372 RepID=A0ABV6NV70_9ACTN